MLNRRGEKKAWERQQAYNHPLMQMQRLKEAGLNPHLVYGQSASGASGSASSPPKSADFDFGRIGSEYSTLQNDYVTRKKQQVEINNLEVQRELMKADIAKRGVETGNILANTAKTKFDLSQAERLKDVSVEAAIENLNNTRRTGTKIDTEIENLIIEGASKKQGIKESEQRVRESIQRIQESSERIKNLRVERDGKGIANEIQKIELQLRKAGINPNDPAYMRVIGRVLDESGLTDKAIKGVRSIGGKVFDYFFKPTR